MSHFAIDTLYVPKAFENNNLEQLHQFIEQFNFATLISQEKGKLHVSHVPVMLDRKHGKNGTLIWHLSKLNMHAAQLAGAKNTLCIFHGPHAYISPTWYKHQPSVPTWNYAVVHAYGTPQEVSAEQLARDLDNMVEHHEAQLNRASNDTIPDDYKSRLIQHIAGFSMEIEHIQGKFKLGQNRSQEDQHNMLNELRNANSASVLSLADFISSLKLEMEAS